MILYNSFYRQYGIRKEADLKGGGEFHPILSLELPKESVLHYFPNGQDDIGPTFGEPIIENHTGYFSIEHYYELKYELGNPKDDPTHLPSVHSKDYKKKFRKIKESRNMERSLRDPKALGILNYAPLVSTKRYVETRYSQYHMWYNAVNSGLDYMLDNVVKYDRHHFLEIEMPKVLPTVRMMVRYNSTTHESSEKLLRVFSNTANLLLTEIFKFIGPRRKESKFSKLSNIHLERLNLIFRDGDRWITLNLGKYLEMMNVAFTDDGFIDEDGKRTEQKFFFKLLLNMVNSRGGVALDDEVLDDDKDEEELKEIEDKYETEDLDVIDNEIKEYEELVVKRITDEIADVEESANEILAEVDPIEAIDDKLLEMVTEGSTSKATYDRLLRLKGEFLNSRSLSKVPLKEYIEVPDTLADITPEQRKINANIDAVVDDSLMENVNKTIEKRYVTEVLSRNITSTMVNGLFASGHVVSDISRERVIDAYNDYEVYKLKVNELNGGSTTLNIEVPKVQDNGTFQANGVTYRMKKQRGDLPIRKTTPAQVALTSYAAKLFINRSERSVSNQDKWVLNKVSQAYMNKDGTIANLEYGDVHYIDLELPRLLSSLSNDFIKITLTDGTVLHFDYKTALDLFDEKEQKLIKREGLFALGDNGKTKYVVDTLHNVYQIKDNKFINTDKTLYDLLGLDITKMPVDHVEMSLYGKATPLAFILLYKLGIDKLLKVLDVNKRIVPVGSQLNKQPDEYVIRLKDVNMIFSRSDYKAQLVLGGLLRYHRSIKKHTYADLNKKDHIMTIFEENGKRIGFMRELEVIYEMFVDPITKEVLKRMGEPTDILGLFIRSVELLTNDKYVEETNPDMMVDRGYERIAGAIYSEFVKAVRAKRSRGIAEDNKISINPKAVWQNIVQDSSVAQIEEINPIEAVKEAEAVTFLGNGGRSKESMVKRTRRFFDSDLGLTGESSVDSGAVGINFYQVHNPDVKDIYGLRDKKPLDEMKGGNLMSTTGVFFPGTDTDEGKRTTFTSIQVKHSVAIEGAIVPPIRTMADVTLAHRVSDLWAAPAEEDVRVTEVNDKIITVVNKDGYSKSYELGRRYGTVPGHNLPYNIKTDLSVGDRVKTGEIICYNESFFEPEPLAKGQVSTKIFTMAKVALIEVAETDEDACVIGPKLMEKLITSQTEKRYVRVKFNNILGDIASIGDHVDSDSVLLTIEDESVGLISGDDRISSNNKDLLMNLSKNAPKAKHAGVVEKIEVFYNGSKEDMSPELKALADKSDRLLSKVSKKTKGVAITGVVDGSVKIDKNNVAPDEAVLVFYLTERLTAGYGDKVVWGNQLKSVVSGVLVGTNKTANTYEEIDAFISYMSSNNRNITSPETYLVVGTITAAIGKQTAEEYLDAIKKG